MTVGERLAALMADGQKRTLDEIAALLPDLNRASLAQRLSSRHMHATTYKREYVDRSSNRQRYWLESAP